MRWLHRLGRLVSMLTTLIGLVIHAGVQTLRQRRQSAPQPAPSHAAAPESATVADIQPEEVHVQGVEIHMPAPSVWPVILAFGIMLLMFGAVTSLGFTIVGAILVAWALGGWLKELYRG